MYCATDFEISAFGSVFFLGVTISTLTMKYGDMLGRGRYFLIGGILNTFVAWSILFWKDQFARYGIMFVYGLGGFQMFLSYMICADFFPNSYMVFIAVF